MINPFKKIKKTREEDEKEGEFRYGIENQSNYNQLQPPPFYESTRPPEQIMQPDIRYTQQYYPLPPQQITQQPYFQQSQPQEYSQDEWESYINGLIEEAIEDKLGNFENMISELKVWKEKLELEISKINEKINSLDSRINNLYDILAKKVEEYDKGIKEATVEVEALHRLIRTMIPAISESTKELKETIEEIKQIRDQLKRP